MYCHILSLVLYNYRQMDLHIHVHTNRHLAQNNCLSSFMDFVDSSVHNLMGETVLNELAAHYTKWWE